LEDDPVSDSDCAVELLERWRTGDQSAARTLYEHYAQSLCALVERRIGQRLRRRIGTDEPVQSAFRTFFRRTADGQYQIDHSVDLWNLLVTITLNKLRHMVERETGKKRDPDREVGLDGQLPNPELIAREPTPEEAAALDDELETLLAKLKPPEPEIVRLRLQGYSTSDIADKLGLARQTIRRKIDRIGTILAQRLRDES
jgi:RNA polymerase sigma factor (sigma-70 family)